MSRCSRKKPDRPRWRITRSSSSIRAWASPRRGAAARVALVDPRRAQLGELAVGIRVLGTRVGVAEIAGQVEPQPLGETAALGHRIGVVGEALGHRLRRCQRVRGVAAPLRLALVERLAQPHRDERVLERTRGPRAWACTLPVATQGTPSRSASSASSLLRRRRGGRTAAAARSAGRPRRRSGAASARPLPRRRGVPPRRRARRRRGRRSRTGTRAPRRGARDRHSA